MGRFGFAAGLTADLFRRGWYFLFDQIHHQIDNVSAKIKKMSSKSVHLIQLLYTPFRDLSSEISIKMVDFSKKVPFPPILSSNRPSFPRVLGSFPADFHVVPGLFSRSSGRMYRSRKSVKTTDQEAFCRIDPFPYIGIVGTLSVETNRCKPRGKLSSPDGLFRPQTKKT